jgi:CheY-like chemotaxis protein
MDRETRRRMFEPFFTTKALGAGTGLGMSMVFGLVKQHGGFVDVTSEPGNGTTVLTYFPMAGAGASLDKRPRDVTAPRGTESVLVAEDEDGVRRLARRSLEGLGYRVTVAATGADALEQLSAEPARFDLVLTDVGMPRLSGPEFYKAARAADISTPFIFMSAYNADDLRAGNKLPAALPFLHKPWTLPDLARRVRDVLDTINARSVLKGRSVLVADGDATSRSVVRARLEEAGAVVIEAPDTDTALRQYRSARADLVVTDPIMADVERDGFVAELRRERPDVRVLAISGAHAVIDANSAGFTRSLTKPFTSAQLLDAAAGALQTEEP